MDTGCCDGNEEEMVYMVYGRMSNRNREASQERARNLENHPCAGIYISPGFARCRSMDLFTYSIALHSLGSLLIDIWTRVQ